MKICIQDPSWVDSAYLLEEILRVCEEATGGAGMFAFASAGGVKLLLQDPVFANFLSKSPCDIVVGVDAITDILALDTLATCEAGHAKLKVNVFLGSTEAPFFHPKICWFRHRKGGVCLVGSGNLTAGGLRGNCEAFSIVQLDSTQQQALEKNWASWLNFHAKDLLPIDHLKVRERAALNSGRETNKGKEGQNVIIEDDKGKISVGPPKSVAAAVLRAEIPRSGNRWNQANFDLKTFKSFFGATPGHTQRIILTHISDEGAEGPQEVRPSVAVSSHNYRFELEAAAGLGYPSHGRPIVVFVRVTTRTFRYRLLMPGTRKHRLASKYLKTHTSFASNHVRRLVTDVKALSRAKFFGGLTDFSNDQM